MKKINKKIKNGAESNFIKNPKTTMEIDKELEPRAYLWSLIEKISQSLDAPIIFQDTNIKKLDDSVDIQDIIQNPDEFDSIFEKCIPKKSKKIHGQFLTPKLIAQFMVQWGMSHHPKKILDPAVGTGIFLNEILNMKSHFDESVGLDIDNLMLNIANIRLNVIKKAKQVKLIHHDYLTYTPTGKKFDFIVCNPPYLKFHSFDRDKSVMKIESETKTKISKLTNIYTLFFLHSDLLLNNDGYMAFITPSDFMITGYGIQLKKFLLSKYSIESILLVDSKNLVFNDANSSAAITLLRKGKPDEKHKVKLIKVQKWEDNKKIFDALNLSESSECVSIVEKLQSELIASEKWLIYFDYNKEQNISGLVPLKAIAKVTRGIATGNNNFFTLSVDDIKNHNIQNEYLMPVISKTRQFMGYSFSKDDFNNLKIKKEKMFLFYFINQSKEPINEYIKYGESIEVNNRYLCKHRDPWYSMEKREAPPILATVFSRNRMRFIYNEAGVLYLTAFHGIYPQFDDDNEIKALLSYLNSNVCSRIIEREKRTYGGGLNHFQPGDLDNILVLDIKKLKKEDIKFLANCFEILSKSKNITEENQIKEKIDEFIADLLTQKSPEKIKKTVQKNLFNI